jgi:hypothetical protein
MMIVEKANAPMPASTESDNSVRSTLIVTLPQRTAAKVRFKSLRSASSADASQLPPAASTSNRNLLMLKIARLRPEKIADWVMQNAMLIQTKTFASNGGYHGAVAIQLNPNRRINHVFTKCVRMA